MSSKRTFVVLLLIVLLLTLFLPGLGSSGQTPDRARAADSMGRIGVRQVNGAAEFYNRATGETFVPRGSNYIDFKETVPGRLWEDYVFGAGTYRPDKLRAEFALLAGHGYNTVRLFFDHCFAGPSCIGQRGGTGLNPDFLDNMVEVMEMAADAGLYLLLTANGVPADGRYWERFDPQFEASRNGFTTFFENGYYLHAAGVAMQEQYWHDLLSGLVARGASFENVLGWQLQNEYFLLTDYAPLSLSAGLVTTANGQTYDMAVPGQKRAMVADNVVHWVDRLAAVVHEYDPEALITLGFFAPNFPNAWPVVPDWYRDPASIIDRAAVDFWDFHLYPETGDNADLMRRLTENFGMTGYTARPVLMGETGAFRHLFSDPGHAITTLQAWMVASCQYGFDGWLIWEHNVRPADDGVWSMAEDDHRMLKALAPSHWPDPCTTPAPVVEIANLALGRPVTVSAFYPALPGAGATDGSRDVEWTAGTHGAQWLEIDLQEPRSINRVALYVAQDPAGATRHVVWALRGDGTRVLLGDFRGVTRHGELLEIALPGMVTDVQRIRVETPVSNTWVGWQEIEVYGDAERSGAACLLTAPGSANLRSGPGTDQELVGGLSAGMMAAAASRAVGADGFTWYGVAGGAWLREDVVSSSAACQALPPG